MPVTVTFSTEMDANDAPPAVMVAQVFANLATAALEGDLAPGAVIEIQDARTDEPIGSATWTIDPAETVQGEM